MFEFPGLPFEYFESLPANKLSAITSYISGRNIAQQEERDSQA